MLKDTADLEGGGAAARLNTRPLQTVVMTRQLLACGERLITQQLQGLQHLYETKRTVPSTVKIRRHRIHGSIWYSQIVCACQQRSMQIVSACMRRAVNKITKS